MCKCTWTISSIKQSNFLPSIFSLFWEKNFNGAEEKTSESHYLFFFPLHPTKHTLKKFSFSFLSNIFHPPYFTTKQTNPQFPSLQMTIVVYVFSTQITGMWKANSTLVTLRQDHRGRDLALTSFCLSSLWILFKAPLKENNSFYPRVESVDQRPLIKLQASIVH